jgi:quinol monooxygenase YgiN
MPYRLFCKTLSFKTLWEKLNNVKEIFYEKCEEIVVVRLEAKAGKEKELEQFLAGALPLAEKELFTLSWYALKLSPTVFGIFDTFADDAGRQQHLQGPIAAALMAKASELLATPPTIDQVDVLAAK